MRRALVASIVALTAAAAAPAWGAPPPPDTHAVAIVIGANHGGGGQAPLRYAEEDARRVAAILVELGGYPADHVRLLLEPSVTELDAAIALASTELAAAAAAGQQTVLFFYYSGHARAAALDLDGQELPLPALRERLTAAHGDLKLVVLDACQSGAFSRPKGAKPAADFSFNSVAHLGASGLAVIASSSASELSQESDRLGGSFFTHHLLVALRGGGDADDDGAVSLDEAYRFAYSQTLVSTAASAIGAQHASFEVDLRGRGAVPITYPRRADAGLELPRALEGDVLVARLPAETVMAEVHKSRGAPMRLALASGRYRALVRLPDGARRCALELVPGGTATLEVASCERAPDEDTVAKLSRRRAWGFDLVVGLGRGVDDGYNQRLRDFGYHEALYSDVDGQLAVSGWLELTPALAGVVELGLVGGGDYQRDTMLEPLRVSWSTTTLGARLRASHTLRSVTFFGEAGGGLAVARTHFTDEAGRESNDLFLGPHAAAAAGVELRPWRRFGILVRGSWMWAPAIDNLIGDTHDSGGLYVGAGLRVHLE